MSFSASSKPQHPFFGSSLTALFLWPNSPILLTTSTMTDVRSLLKSERAARRIQHKYASYSSAGSLLCLVCHLHIKSESLWEGHLKSAGHVMRLQKLQEQEQEPAVKPPAEANNKKRKADHEDDTIRKRTRAPNGVPEGFFDPGAHIQSEAPAIQPGKEMQIPSRPATPSKPITPIEEAPKPPVVDEDEWAAFEADIAFAEAPADAVISAPAISAADLETQSIEQSNARRKERQEAELEGDKEDAVRKLEDEFEQMEGLEQRVRKLREKREALRQKEGAIHLSPAQGNLQLVEPMDDDDDDEDDDDWDGFRMKG